MVDDNPKNLQVLGNLLNNEGYSIEFALDGKHALDWIKQKDFDMILLDVMMPEMNGFEVCRIFKVDIRHKNIPVIFLTANTDINYTIQGFDLGAVDYIHKPFNKQELLSRVSLHLELKKSRDIIEQYNKDLEVKNKLTTYSLKYAKKIQKAVLLSEYESLKVFQDYFLLFKPKDIISGDFYWSFEFPDKIIFAIMDCTGHGVPGALMTMLGITFLNETVISERISVPDQIFNRLREKIINTLGQKGIVKEVHDGMDGVIISINRNMKRLQFSGAFNSLYLIRNNNLSIMKGDRMPVGQFQLMKNFSLKQFDLSEGDTIYLFTDGYPDQFGGERDSKFKVHKFREMLLTIHKKPMPVQKELLNRHFKEWKGDSEQTDDVTVLGIRI